MKKILVLVFVFFLILFSYCGKKKVADDFSTGLANRDEKIKEGIQYIEKMETRKAKDFFENIGKENPKHCGFLIGFPLANIQEYLAKISSIINFAANFYGAGASRFHISQNQQSEYCDNSFDNIVRDFVLGLHRATSGGIELIKQALAQGCEMDINYPIALSVGPNFSIYLVLSGRIGKAELSFLRYFGNFVLIISDIILAHDFSLNTLSILSNITKIDNSDVIGLIRSLAFIVQGCRKTLAFHTTDKVFLQEIPDRITEIIKGVFEFLAFLEERNGRQEYMITFQDGSGEGKLGYNPDTATINTPQDEIKINVSGTVSVSELKGSLKAVKIKVPYLIDFKFISDLKKLADKVSDIIENRKKGCPENCISVADLNLFLKPFGIYLDDFLRIDIVNFMENPKPLRDIFPYWFYNGDRWEFMIEAEVPESREENKPYLFNYDSGHFFFPDVITFYGRTISDFAIPSDCVFIKNVPLNWILIPYLLFQDPTFNDSAYARLKGVLIERCNTYDIEYDTEEWKTTNNYMINKSIAILVQKTGSIISPLTDLILRSIEIIQ